MFWDRANIRKKIPSYGQTKPNYNFFHYSGPFECFITMDPRIIATNPQRSSKSVLILTWPVFHALLKVCRVNAEKSCIHCQPLSSPTCFSRYPCHPECCQSLWNSWQVSHCSTLPRPADKWPQLHQPHSQCLQTQGGLLR